MANDKKKVLYADPISYNNHYGYNYNNIRILSKICNLSLFVKENYINTDSLEIEECFFWDKKYCWDNIPHKTRLSYFIRTGHSFLHNLRKILRLLKKNKYDLLIISCVDIALFSVATKFIKKNNIAFVDHGIYLSLERKYVKKSWKMLNKRLKVCALEAYFFPYIREELKIKNEIYLLRHPLNFNSKKTVASLGNKAFVFFAPSSSNPVSFARELKKKETLIPQNIRIVCNGDFDYVGDNLLVYSGKLPRDEYDEYFCKASGIIIPYDSSYNYRTSGVIFDSIVNKKPVIIQKGNTLSYYTSRYPSIFIPYDGYQELIEVISKKQIIINPSCFDEFIKEYNDNEIRNEFLDLLNGRFVR